MDKGENFGIGVGFEGVFDLGGIHRRAPGIVHYHRHTTTAPHVFNHAPTKHAVAAHDDFVTWLDEIHKARLHADRTRPRHRKRERIFSLKSIP